jgi:hypothetical protein
MQWDSYPEMEIDQNKEYTATIKTNYGDISVELLPQDARSLIRISEPTRRS